MTARLLMLVSLAAALASCRAEHVFRKIDPSFDRMLVQPRYNAYKRSKFFDNDSAMRRPPDGTVAFSESARRPAVTTGVEHGRPVDRIPVPVTRATLERGQKRFDTFCAACHGVLGNSNTVVAEHMGRPPPSLQQTRIRKLPDGKIFSVISTGYGLMPDYAAQLGVDDRWAVVAYVRALQLSQRARVADLTPAMRTELHAEAP